MGNGLPARLWEDRWRIAAWILPALLLTAVAHRALLPLAGNLRDVRAQMALLAENRYEPAWLDSTRAALETEVELLKGFKQAREGALNRDAGVQATVDRVRALAQASGIEVIKTTPIIGKADSLGLLKVRIEGFARYGSLLDFFSRARAGNPDLFPEEMIIRQGGDRASGRLEAVLVIHVYERRRGNPT